MVIIGAKKLPSDQEYESFEKWGYFNFSRIQDATKNFSPANVIGEGCFGRVYKGVLRNGTAIAVKVSSIEPHTMAGFMLEEILNEEEFLCSLRHPNLVKFLGYCRENNQLLIVYEYMKNGSLARALFGPDQNLKRILNWQIRVRICLGIAKGLAYLHEDKSKVKIVHRNTKPLNIFLDEYFNPKILDFELARHYQGDNTHISTCISGPMGYMAPDYIRCGILTDKTDVYIFGVVMLELMSGRPNAPKDLRTRRVVDVAKHLQKKGDLLALIDEDLKTSISVKEATTVLDLAMLCINDSPTLRPTMSEVVRILEGKTIMIIPLLKSHCLTTVESDRDKDEDDAKDEDNPRNAFHGQLDSNETESMDEGGEGVRMLIPANVVTISRPPICPPRFTTSSFFMGGTKMEDGAELEYVEPSFEGGKHHIECSNEEIEAGYNEWKDSLVGFLLEENEEPFNIDKEMVEELWEVKGNVSVSTMGNGHFLFQFSCVEDKTRVLESSDLWHIKQRILILRKWDWMMKYDKTDEMKSLPVWVKIYKLPLFLWTSSFFSKLGSGFGIPLYVDQKTKSRERLVYAKLCIEVDAAKPLPEFWNISVKGVDYQLTLEYDWKPLRCANCSTFGHIESKCRLKMQETEQN